QELSHAHYPLRSSESPTHPSLALNIPCAQDLVKREPDGIYSRSLAGARGLASGRPSPGSRFAGTATPGFPQDLLGIAHECKDSRVPALMLVEEPPVELWKARA